MKIYIEPSSYSCLNMGDLAMLQVTVSRVKSAFKNAELYIPTNSPERLTNLFPGVNPVPGPGRKMWFTYGIVPTRIHRILRSAEAKRWEKNARRSVPYFWEVLLKAKLSIRKTDFRELNNFLDALHEADMIIISGMGGINDSFSRHALTVLDILDIGQKRGIPTLMFGQGFGPITNPELRKRAAEVLPKVDFIAVREGRASVPLLISLGVERSKVVVTGDDAVELSYPARGQELGTCIGINLRRASYSAVGSESLPSLSKALFASVKTYQTSLIPVPISHNSSDNDPTTIRKLLNAYDASADGGETLTTVEKVVGQIARCRLVVTGSYHAGVFALSQGIPVIGIANSPYYVDKFMGLQDQFGFGCDVILLENASEQLGPAIDKLWAEADSMRSPLLAAASRQIAASRAAYQQAFRTLGFS